ncbi:MAG: hypothetical protein JO250_18185 [Armatimonadetes bacterium]|nr:hypothetical protein [Armatimonadota bacterium]
MHPPLVTICVGAVSLFAIYWPRMIRSDGGTGEGRTSRQKAATWISAHSDWLLCVPAGLIIFVWQREHGWPALRAIVAGVAFSTGSGACLLAKHCCLTWKRRREKIEGKV